MTPDRARIEAHLSEDDVARIHRLARRIGLRDLDRWPEVPLFSGWVFLACEEAADRVFAQRRTRSRKQARRIACGELGVSFDAHDRRERRAREQIADKMSAAAPGSVSKLPGMKPSSTRAGT